MTQDLHDRPSLGEDLDRRVRAAWAGYADDPVPVIGPHPHPHERVTNDRPDADPAVVRAPFPTHRRRFGVLVAAAAAVLVVGVGVPWAASELTSRPGVSDAPTTTPTLGIEPAPFEAGPDGDLARLYGAGFAAGIDPLNLGIRLDPATGTVLASTLPERLATLDAAVRPLAEELGYAYTSTPWDAPQTMDEVPAIQVPMGEVGLVLEGLYAGERTYGIYLNFAAEALTVWRGAPDAKRDAAAHAAGEAVGIDVQVLGATWTFDDRDALLAQLQGRQDEWRALGFTVEHTRALPTGAIVGVLGDVAAAEAALVGAPGIVGVEEHVEVAAPQPLTS